MATFISTFIKSALFLSTLSFMFWYFFPQMFDSFVFHMSDYFLPFSTFGRASTLDAVRSFISTLIPYTIILSASVVSLVQKIFPQATESFRSYMIDRFFPKLFDFIFSWIAEKANYFRSLEHTLKALDEALNGLLALKENVISKVNAAEQNPNMRQKKEVTLWLDKVKDVEIEVLELRGVIVGEIASLHLGGFFSKLNFKSRYEFGKKVDNLKQEMTKLKDEGGNIKDEVAERAPAASAIRLATERIMATKGQQSTLDEVWGCLRGEPAVEFIGLYGPGGVGKTTLLKEINNKFCDESNGFQDVIWVVVSNNPIVEKIQKEIGKRIGFSGKSWEKRSREEKAQDISDALAKKKFALLLDDIWNWIDLTEVGVPLQCLKSSGSKIVFTTRKHDVCDSMKSKKFEVKCLSDKEARELFEETVGKDTLHDPSILEQAKIMYKECDGLPLALVVIGRAMSSKRKLQEWKLAIQDLTRLSSEISGVEEKVYYCLRFSYDNLSEDTIRCCFLYCSLFPEDYKISKRNLLDCWVGEGFVDVYDRGFSIIGELVRACLLEEEEDEFDDYVKMHDVIRDMVLWIAKKEKKNFLVEAGVGLTRSPEVEKWEGIKRLSLMENKIESLSTVPPTCPDLETLFFNNNSLREITDDFFQSMPSLKVLNLSSNELFEREFSLGILNLVSLQYLDLSKTCIRELPKALDVLINLKCLKAEFTVNLCTIPKHLISKFKKLQVLRLLGCDFFNEAKEDSVLYDDSESLIQELVALKELNALSLSLKSCRALEILLESGKLKGCTQFLELLRFEGSKTPNILFFKDLKNLDTFRMRFCNSLKSLEMNFVDKISIDTHCFHSIETVEITACYDLLDLTWLILAPNLKKIIISACYNMEEIINDEKLRGVQRMTGCLNPFEKLQVLRLNDVPLLKSIYQNALSFPHLKVIRVIDCPNIKKLPLESNTTKNRQISIYGREDWWEELQWEDEATKNAFLPRYKGR